MLLSDLLQDHLIRTPNALTTWVTHNTPGSLRLDASLRGGGNEIQRNKAKVDYEDKHEVKVKPVIKQRKPEDASEGLTSDE